MRILNSGSVGASVTSGLCALGFNSPVVGNLTAASIFNQGSSPSLLFTDSANNLLYVVNSPGGSTPLSVEEYPLSDGAGPITVSDLNNDGRLDIVVNGQSGMTANIFLNSGNGLTPWSRHTGSGGIHSLLLRDVNGDGLADLIAEGPNGHIDVFPGNGDGTFSTTSIGGTGPLDGLTGNGGHLITIADLNHDGQLDALTATPAGVSTLLGAGTSYLKLGGIYNAGPGHTSYAVADFNGDGNLDLALDSPEGIAILFGNTDGSFQTSRAYAAGATALSGTTGNFTASGNLDEVVSTSDIQAELLLGQGDGSFLASAKPVNLTQPLNSPSFFGFWSTVGVADFDQDGQLDVFLTGDGPSSLILSPRFGPGFLYFNGTGNGTFNLPTGIQDNVNPSSPNPHNGTSALLDKGPFLQPRIVNLDSEYLWAIDAPHKGFVADATSITSASPARAHNIVATGAFVHPPALDIVAESQGSVRLFASQGTGFSSAAFGDLATDGSLTTPGQLTAPNMSSTFGGISPTFNQPYFPGSITTADLDRDGNTDLLITYANLAADPTNPSTSTPNYLYVWYGSGGGKFLVSPAHPVNPVRIQLSRNYYQVAVADLNNDGIPDLILSDGYLISYQLGVGDGTFGAEHHLLGGRGINTISTADLRNRGVLDLVIANGGATFSNPVINHEILTPDPDVNTGGVTVLLNPVTPKAANATLTASPEPSVFYSAYTLTANEGSQTGTVTFSQDATLLGTAATVNGIATYTVPAANEYLPGTHALTATFPTGSTTTQQTTATHTIARAPVSINLTPTTPLTVYYGQGIDGVFGVSVVDSNYPANGNYTLLDNGVAVPICTSIPVAQTCPYGNPILLDAGSHTLSVNYLGDAVNAPGTSAGIAYQILPDLTTITLVSSKNPANLQDSITFTATVSGNDSSPSGAVNFLDAGTLIGSGTLTPGPNNLATVTFTTANLTLGTHPITAVYAGNTDFNPATSAVLNQVIQPVSLGNQASLTTLTADLNPSAPKQLVTFTAQVQLPGVFATVATGTVTFLDGTTVLGTGTLNNFGVATYQTAALVTGTHPITASYAGVVSTTAPAILPSTSPVLNQVVTIPITPSGVGFLMNVTPASLSVDTGRTGTLTVSIVALSGFNQPVALSCASPAPETRCTFLPSSTVPPGGGNVTLQLATNAPRDCNTNTPYGGISSNTVPRWPFGIAAATLCFVAIRRRRYKALLFLAAASALATLSGCGHCTDLGTRPGNYSFTITAVAQGGPTTETRTATVPLKVTVPGS